MVGLLGTGAFATVYRAHDPSLDADVAIKVLADHHSNNVDIRSRFIAEGRLLRRVDDHRVVTVHDIGEHNGRPYLVLELIDGGTLDDLVAEQPAHVEALDATALVRLVLDLAGGLGAMHAHGIVHRDVKPSNVLMRSNGDFVLADLGFARDSNLSSMTIAGGSEGFMAPEQRRPGTDIDPRADVHAASAVIGRTVFGPNWQALLVGDRSTGATLVEPVGSEPLTFELRRGLSTGRDARHATIDEWAAALIAALGDTGETVSAEHDLRTSRRPVLRLVAAGLAVSGMLAAGALVVAPSGSDAPVSVPTGEPDGPDIVGPDEILLGDPARFDHTDVAGRTYRWVVPPGAVLDGDTIVFTPDSARDFDITLIEVDGDAERVSTRRIRVRTR